MAKAGFAEGSWSREGRSLAAARIGSGLPDRLPDFPPTIRLRNTGPDRFAWESNYRHALMAMPQPSIGQNRKQGRVKGN
jgi:hypothetical protein